MTRDRVKSFNQISFSKQMVSPRICREGERCWFRWWRTDINISNFAVASKQHFTNFCPDQRPPEARGQPRDDLIYPLYWINVSTNVRFWVKQVNMSVSCHTICPRRLTCLWRGTTVEQLPAFWTNTRGHPACAGSRQITTHCLPPVERGTNRTICWPAVGDVFLARLTKNLCWDSVQNEQSSLERVL